MPRMANGRIVLDQPESWGQELTVVPEFPLPGATRPRLFTDGQGKLWVGKELSQAQWRAEVVGYLLGRSLGVPVPEVVGVRRANGRRLCLSEFQEAAANWSRAGAELADNYGDLGRMLVLDALTGNMDRNFRNILLQPLAELTARASYHLWFIDHEASLVADLPRLLGHDTRAPRLGTLPMDFPVDPMVEQEALDAATTASSLPEAELRAIAAAACVDGGDTLEEDLAVALGERSGAAESIVASYIARIRERR